MVLIDRHFAGLQTPNAFRIDIRAGHFMPRRSKARPRHQAYVTTSNHRETQVRISLEAHRQTTQRFSEFIADSLF